jgi:hypothetical protein
MTKRALRLPRLAQRQGVPVSVRIASHMRWHLNADRRLAHGDGEGEGIAREIATSWIRGVADLGGSVLP